SREWSCGGSFLQFEELEVLEERRVATDEYMREARRAVEEAQAHDVELHEARERARDEAPWARPHALLVERPGMQGRVAILLGDVGRDVLGRVVQQVPVEPADFGGGEHRFVTPL